jgi:IPT/TIG domain
MNVLARLPRRIVLLAVGLASVLAALVFGVPGPAPAAAAAAPTLTAIAPTTGTFAGGTAVTLTGSGFLAGAAVTFDGVAATGIVVVSATQITATTPAGAVGAPVVVVTNPAGQGVTLTGAFHYLGPPPTLTTVAPATGTTNGGDTITLTGTQFAAGMTVTVGGVAATGVSVVSTTQATAVTAASAAGGAVNVVVTNPDTQTATLAAGFTYIIAPPPSVTAVSPASGTNAGGTTVTISGANFASGATVLFGATAATAVVVDSATTIEAKAPAGAVGPTVVVTVTNPDTQAGALAAGYTWINTPAPVIWSVDPSTSPLAGGGTFAISGSGFVEGATVKVGATAATVTSLTSTEIDAVAPASTATNGATVAVSVTNPDKDTTSLANAFQYLPAPTIKSVKPTVVATAGGDTLTLTGTAFVDGATVTVGGVNAVATWVSATQMTVIAPALFAGYADIDVENPDMQSGYLYGAVDFVDAPAVTGITPVSGPTGGGTAVTIVGTNFAYGMTVKFGTAAATNVTVVDAQTATATSPAGAAGIASVTVADANGLGGGSASFVYTAPAPPHFSLGQVPTQGFGLVGFSGGTSDQLVAAATAAGCDRTTAAFFVTVDGKFIVYLPPAPTIVNAAWTAYFANGIPANQTMVMRCN